MGRHFLGLVALLLLMEVLALASNIRLAGTESATIAVPDDFPTIQEAINNAVDGDVIFVKAGIYYEHVVVNKTVALVGEDVSTTIVDGNSTGHVISVIRDNVSITGFTVQRSGNIHYPPGEAGICLNHAADCVVSGNHLVDNGWCGISLLYSQRNIIIDNNVTNSGWGGIHLLTSSHNIVSRNIVDNTYGPINGHASSHYNNITENVISNSTYGMFYHNANYNNIFRNSISDIAVEGIWLQDLVSYNTVAENNLINNTIAIRLQGPNQNNIFERNVITGAEYGMKIQNYARYTLVTENTIDENDYGIWIDGGSTTNTFYYNSFLNNTQHVNVVGFSINNWDNGYPSGGNYWSDYTGSYLDHDGIGDVNYTINANNMDMYPLMGMFSDFNATSERHVQTICNSTISEFQFNGMAISFDVSGENDTTGFCRVCLPTALMNETYHIFVNGTEISYTPLTDISNSTHNYLYFTYEHSTKEVIIILEFPSLIILPLFMITTLLAALTYRRKNLT